MRTAFLSFVLIAAFGSAMACSDDSDDGANGDATGCEAFCARSLDCPNDPAPNCVGTCQLSNSLCPAESAAARACTEPRPDSDFYCEPQTGVTAPMPTICEAERDALFDCLIEEAL